MVLPVCPPVRPMLARLGRELPAGEGWHYEPKWDGFRCVVFRDGDTVSLWSRNERPFDRYFPELLSPLGGSLPDRAVVDGEIVIAGPGGLDFDALLQRIHPAASRVRRLAETTPASFVAFDLLALGDEDLRTTPFDRRRRQLAGALAGVRPPVHVTPSTTDRATALDWFSRFEGAGLDGVVAKAADLRYVEGERAMVKVKHERTADCVVGGYRHHTHGGIGSLLLGLFDRTGTLHRVGVCSSFSTARRQELREELVPFRLAPGQPHPWAGGEAGVEGTPTDPPNRWSRGRDASWEPIAPVLVCEVAYDHLQGDRFRHATTFRRWRHDRDPDSCTYDQLASPVPTELRQVFSIPGD
ncbi:MAG: ATP-dependent DNA ligase [Acidimicrobiales bacterium]